MEKVHVVALVQPAVELIHGENFHQIKMRGNVEQAGFGHGNFAVKIALVTGGIFRFRQIFPFQRGHVQPPAPDEMHTAQQVVIGIRGDGLFDEVRFRVQPVHFQPEQHLIGVLILQFQHLTGVVVHVRGQMFAVFLRVIVAQRARGMFGKAVEGKAAPAGGGKHFLRGVFAVGIGRVGVQVDGDHGNAFVIGKNRRVRRCVCAKKSPCRNIRQ